MTVRGRLAIVVVGLSAVTGAACQYGATTPSPTAPSSASVSAATSGSTQTTGLTYTADIQPILAADCTRCHGPSRQDAGYDLNTYAGVMRAVSPGNANSLLILVTRSGGLMYGEFSGNAGQKALTIYNWIVSSNAAQ